MMPHLRPFSARKKTSGMLGRLVWLGWAATILSIELLVLWLWLRRRSGTITSPEVWEHPEILLPEIETTASERAAPAKSSEPGSSKLSPDGAAERLERIEGIGPKVASLLNEAGIHTFAQLAETEVGRLNKLLQDNRLNFINPSTWPAQARLAAGGRWQDLEALQNELKGGRRSG
jgi:predicted flap endonuclease-1-like 5' DNA nuclease